MILRKLWTSSALLVLTTVGGSAQNQSPGVTATEIKIGQTVPYSGPASAWGTVGKAAAAYFEKINAQGGIGGRKINLISLDDAYSPPKTVEQTRKLVESEEVLLTFGSLGTATNTAVQRYLNARKVPQLFVISGSSNFTEPKKSPWSIGWLPAYATEAAILAKYALRTTPAPKIAILYQHDDFGKDYLDGFEAALGPAAQSIVAKVSYEVTSSTVDSQIVTLAATGANVFFNISSPKFAAQAIRKAHEIGWKPLLLVPNISASIVSVLKPVGVEASRGVISAAYAKDPADPQWKDDPGVKEFMNFITAHGKALDPMDSSTVTGYLAAQTFVSVIAKAGGDLRRESIMKIATHLEGLSLPMLLPGVTIDIRPDDFLTFRKEAIRRFDGERWNLVGDVVER